MAQNNYEGALQQPIGSGFSAASTTSDVIKGIDLTGKIAIVTGGSTGIGQETVKTLSQAGATVIVPARDTDKARKNLKDIARVEIEELDLIDPLSIDSFAEKFLASGRPLHLLIDNAGIMFVPLRRDARGNESQLATNYLAVFRLTARLWEPLKKANGARVVNVSSMGHHFAPFNFEDPNFTNHEYQTLAAYGQSKTALNLFSLELDNRAKAFGVRAFSLHPGNIWGTELTREAPLEILQRFGFYDEKGDLVQDVIDSLKTIPQGAATTIWAATSAALNDLGGVYLEDVDIAKLAEDESASDGVNPYALKEASAKKLWQLTEELTGITFNIA
ncbi:NAD(P)-dependent dehydrogenase, short-chain alcohol dehydrogenase family [Pedobacter westerhofensis]|uniref:NAD(P)-dependent dehydrogenase, short-chain alcohol dehydrogenase family n=1 Tax=Pedobacter westerhofensis TaxID=425512 RepID=A0A521AK14_9SPHI|nr:SDR family NAD(P)-dependent oxidoreductase [Pedobacter westerhofensis]SMO35142.1 NAD(P)-dependent dehydrogenase, short-chain alcohol dehydrogenase family [Pedobacter westerhofensis]